MTIREDMDTSEADMSKAAGTEPAGGITDLRRLVNGVIWPGFSGRTVPAWLDTELRHGLAGVVYSARTSIPGIPPRWPGSRPQSRKLTRSP